MKRSRFRRSLITILLGLSCSVELACRTHGVSQKMLRIDRTSNNTEQIVTIGQEIEISLPENPTTGFRWEVQAGGDPALSLMNDAFDPPQAGLGTAGTRRWRFTAAREGPGSVVIVYRRAFERDKPPADVFRFTARVQQ